MRAGHVAQLGGAVCDPAPGPSHVGGPSMQAQCEHRGPHLFAAKALVPGMLPQGLNADSLVQVPQSVIPEYYAPIRVVPSQSTYSTGNPSQSESISQRG